MRRFLPILSLVMSGCVYQLPYLMSASDTPTTQPLRLEGRASAKGCQTYVFGVIPTGTPYTSRALLDRARGQADLLVRISWDRQVTNYLFVQEVCDVVYATLAYYEDFPTRGVSTSTDLGEPDPTGLQFDMGPGRGVDAMEGLDIHHWGDPQWPGLTDIVVTPGRRLGTAAQSSVVIEGLDVQRLRYGIGEDGLNEIRFEADSSPIGMLTRRFGPPNGSASDREEWLGDSVQIIVIGKQVQIRHM